MGWFYHIIQQAILFDGLSYGAQRTWIPQRVVFFFGSTAEAPVSFLRPSPGCLFKV